MSAGRLVVQHSRGARTWSEVDKHYHHLTILFSSLAPFFLRPSVFSFSLAVSPLFLILAYFPLSLLSTSLYFLSLSFAIAHSFSRYISLSISFLIRI